MTSPPPAKSVPVRPPRAVKLTHGRERFGPRPAPPPIVSTAQAPSGSRKASRPSTTSGRLRCRKSRHTYGNLRRPGHAGSGCWMGPPLPLRRDARRRPNPVEPRLTAALGRYSSPTRNGRLPRPRPRSTSCTDTVPAPCLTVHAAMSNQGRSPRLIFDGYPVASPPPTASANQDNR